MSKNTECYTSVMYGVLDVVRTDGLKKRDRYHSKNVEDDSVPKALLTTRHEPLIAMLLDDNIDYRILTELLNAYLGNGELEKVVDLLVTNKKDNVGIDFEKLIVALIEQNADDSLIIKFADYQSQTKKNSYSLREEGEGYYVRLLILSLWKVGRYDLAKKIVDEHVRKDVRPFYVFLEEASQGNEHSPEDIVKIFEDFCPKKDNAKSDYFVADAAGKVAESFMRELRDMDVSMELIMTAYIEYKARHQSGQMGYISGSTSDFESVIRRYLISQDRLDEAEEFAKECGWGYWGEMEVLSIRLKRAIEQKDEKEHKRLLDRMVEIKKEKIKKCLKEDEYKKDSKVLTEEEFLASAEYHRRTNYYEHHADIECEQAIYELIHGTSDSAQPYIDQMIHWVDMIGTPMKEECPIQHLKTLRRFKKVHKRSLRERFHVLGLTEYLPKYDRWSDPILVTTGESSERREKNRKERMEAHVEQSDVAPDQIPDWEKEKNDQLQALLDKKDIDGAIEWLKADCTWIAREGEWARGIMLLNVAPKRFEDIFAVLAKTHFDVQRYDMRELQHDGLSRFLVEAKRLNVLKQEHLDKVFHLWERLSKMREGGTDSISPSGVVTLISEFLSFGYWEDAVKSFKTLYKTGELSRPSTSKCLSMFIKYASDRLGDEQSGSSVAFLDQDLPPNTTKSQRIEYWNSRIELLLASGDEQGYEGAYSELLDLLDTPNSVRIWTRLMAIGSLRTSHKKKDGLLGAYFRNKDSKSARVNIVEAMIDHGIPGAEAMPEVKSKDTPDQTTIRLLKKLVEKEVLHRHTLKYLSKAYLPIIRSLLSQHQNQFNTVMEVVETEVSEGRLSLQDWNGLFAVLRHIGVITPGIYRDAKARGFDEDELKEMGVRLQKLKKDIFSNRPIDEENSPEMVAELVSLTYQPANMSFSSIVHFCEHIRDCTHHLDRFKFPQNGYELDLMGATNMVLREGVRLNTPRAVYSRPETVKRQPHSCGHTESPYLDIAQALCKIGRFKHNDITLDHLLAIFESDGFMKSALKESRRAETDDARYRSLRVLQEAFGIYIYDNLEATVKVFLKRGKKEVSKTISGFVEAIKKPGRAQALKNQLGIILDSGMSDIDLAALVISRVALEKFKPLQEMRRGISKDLTNFAPEGDDEMASSAGIRLRAVVSKNIPSFFAKASAGICTANDTELFHRSDHFHINIIDDRKEKCVGNVQAYIMEHEGEEYLLLRGFNPSTNLLKDVDAGSLCDAIIRSGEQFAQDNGLAGVLISEQGGFLALSNRDEVTKYIERKYKDNLMGIEGFNISGGITIDAVFNTRGSSKVRPSSLLQGRVFNEDGFSSAAAGIS